MEAMDYFSKGPEAYPLPDKEIRNLVTVLDCEFYVDLVEHP